MTHYATGLRIARALHGAEHAVDDALLKTAALITEMVQGRKTAQLAAEVGQPEFDHAMEMMTGLAQARRAVVANHKGLSAVAEAQGIAWRREGTRMDGPLEQKERPPLGLVVAAA
ncbi:hypothetical protein BZG35_08335 [Brevundimonas sp. LM2]|uniref:hypothetical protein n=1 Tax=Brevundimonas sp. LM2 TaxID=1938605 RepID=UPI000983C663|nr:hypothetical protein [Brevundimonas sp. LM2]AQR61657.1 hypothetical protein BZG35_08335 [Brevundimonas sp. LM2]